MNPDLQYTRFSTQVFLLNFCWCFFASFLCSLLVCFVCFCLVFVGIITFWCFCYYSLCTWRVDCKNPAPGRCFCVDSEVEVKISGFRGPKIKENYLEQLL